jgi:hypothetical protein
MDFGYNIFPGNGTAFQTKEAEEKIGIHGVSTTSEAPAAGQACGQACRSETKILISHDAYA